MGSNIDAAGNSPCSYPLFSPLLSPLLPPSLFPCARPPSPLPPPSLLSQVVLPEGVTETNVTFLNELGQKLVGTYVDAGGAAGAYRH